MDVSHQRSLCSVTEMLALLRCRLDVYSFPTLLGTICWNAQQRHSFNIFTAVLYILRKETSTDCKMGNSGIHKQITCYVTGPFGSWREISRRSRLSQHFLILLGLTGKPVLYFKYSLSHCFLSPSHLPALALPSLLASQRNISCSVLLSWSIHPRMAELKKHWRHLEWAAKQFLGQPSMGNIKVLELWLYWVKWCRMAALYIAVI